MMDLCAWPLYNHLKKYAETIEFLRHYADKFQKYDDILIVGTGGSSLGAQALWALATPTTSTPRLHFIDNIDSFTFLQTMTQLNPETTGVLAISKSGNTFETLTQTLLILQMFESVDVTQHMCVITESPLDTTPHNTTSALYDVAQELGIPIIAHPHDVGGRYSVFTCVGLLPAMIAGIDVTPFCKGALDTLENVISDPTRCAPYVNALAHDGFTKEGIMQLVLFIYCDRLLKFGHWFAQLWGESLGKKDAQGQSHGTTPICARGAVDQHSQLQLYLDGPRNKHFKVITLENHPPSPIITTAHSQHPLIQTLQGVSMDQLMIAEQKATIDTLRAHNRPVCVMNIPQLTCHELGIIMMHSMVEVLFLADLWHINPFDQPAVEQGKKKTLDYLTLNTPKNIPPV